MEVTKKSETKRKAKAKKSETDGSRKAAARGGGSVMDSEIWKELHKELVEEVIARVPTSTLFVCRTVCQEWNNLSRSPSFLRHWSDLASQSRPLFHINITTGCAKKPVVRGVMYDPCTKKLHRSSIMPVPTLYSAAAASAGGLVCYMSHLSFKVGNPLTQTWRIFPRSTNTLVEVYPTMGFVMLNQQVSEIIRVDNYGSYEIYRLSCGSSTPHTITKAKFPPNIKWRNFRNATTVSVNSVFYVMGRSRSCNDGGIMSIVSYDAVNGSWDQDLIPSPRDLHYAFLAEGGGQVLLLDMVKEKDSSINVCVWKFQRGSNNNCSWIMVDTMPTAWCSEFSGKYVSMRCFSNSRLLGMSLHSNILRMYTYDVITREWTKLPPSLPHVRGFNNAIAGLAFFPSLTASI